MEIIEELHSSIIQEEQVAFEQLEEWEPMQIIKIYTQIEDVMLLMTLDFRRLNDSEICELAGIEHRKASELLAQVAASSELNFASCTALLFQHQNEEIKANFAIELLLEQSNFERQVYQLVMRETWTKLQIVVAVLETVCETCEPIGEDFQAVITNSFLEEAISSPFVGQTSQMLISLFNKFEYKTECSPESTLLCSTLCCMLRYENTDENVVELVSRLFSLAVNKRLHLYHLFLPFLRYSIKCLYEYNHFKCHLLLPGLIKLFENRQIEEVRNIFIEMQQGIGEPEQQETLSQILESMLKSMPIDVETVCEFSQAIDEIVRELISVMLRFIDKRGLRNLLELNNFKQGSIPSLAPNEEALYQKYNTYDPLFWLDWLGSLKGAVQSLFSKIVLLYPELSLKISYEMLYDAWAAVQALEAENMITEKHDMYINFDISVFFAETTVCVVLKQLVNENEYAKEAMLDLNPYIEVVQLLLVTQFPEPAIMYRTLSAAFEIVKFLSRFVVSQQSQASLMAKYHIFLQRLVRTVLEQVCTTINFRMPSEMGTQQECLFEQLSEDTLALRRMIVTKLNAYLSSETINMLLVDRSELSEDVTVSFEFHESLIECLNHYFDSRELTETETIRLTLVKLSVLISINQIQKKHNLTGETELLSDLMQQTLSSIEGYFLQPTIQAATTDCRAFIAHFRISANSFEITTPEAIKPKRVLLFKLEEALSTLPKIEEIANSQEIVELIASLTQMVERILTLILEISVEMRYISQSFVFNNTSLKINLLSEQPEQYLKIDDDSSQPLSTETGYTLEWLESSAAFCLQILVSMTEIGAISRVLSSCSVASLPFSILKTIFDKLQRLEFSAMEMQVFRVLYDSVRPYISYFYEPEHFLQRLDPRSPLYTAFCEYIVGLPTEVRPVDQTQIVSRTPCINREQIEAAMQEIVEAAARSYVELVSKMFYDFGSKVQIFQPSIGDVIFLTACCFVENKPGRILSLCEELELNCDASAMLPALLLLCAVDGAVTTQVVAVICRNAAAFPNVVTMLPVTEADLLNLSTAKRNLTLALRQAGITE